MSRTNPILAVPLIANAGCPGNTVRQGEGALEPAVAIYAVFTFAGIELLDHLGYSNLGEDVANPSIGCCRPAPGPQSILDLDAGNFQFPCPTIDRDWVHVRCDFPCCE